MRPVVGPRTVPGLAATFGRRMQMLRADQTLQAFVSQSGFPMSTVQTWLYRGQVPSGHTLVRLSQAFDVSTDWLLGLTEKRNTHE